MLQRQRFGQVSTLLFLLSFSLSVSPFDKPEQML